MGDDFQRHHDLTIALQKATAFRQDAESRWRAAIAEAHEAGVPLNTIIKTAGSGSAADALLVQEILREGFRR